MASWRGLLLPEDYRRCAAIANRPAAVGYEQGLADYVLDAVRGEVIVGNGYPYVIEAADQTAVISTQDREVFYAAFQEFAQRKGFELKIARKAISKAHRR
jgi:hypothetical protein